MSHSCSTCGAHDHAPNHGRRVPPPKALLRLSKAGVRYERESEWAVHGVDLEVGPGEIVALIGPNGAGKTSLLRAVAGLVPLTEGVLEWPSGRPGIGYVPQQPALDRNLPVSVEEFLLLRRGVKKRRFFGGLGASAEARDEARARLAELGAGALAERRLGELSGGEFQRVLIAYALIGDPALLLLDEPMTGIDVRGGRDFHDVIADLRRSRGLAVLMVSHDLHMVGGLADIVVCLNRHLCATGTPAEVLREHVLAGVYGGAVAGVQIPKPASA